MKEKKIFWFIANVVVMYYAMWIMIKLNYKWYGIIIAILLNAIFYSVYNMIKK